MKSIEISARTVAEARALALAQLGKDRDEVAIAVLDSGETGDEALVRVTVVDDEDEADEPPARAVTTVEEAQEIARKILDDLLERMDIHAYVTPVVTRVP